MSNEGNRLAPESDFDRHGMTATPGTKSWPADDDQPGEWPDAASDTDGREP